MSTVPFLGAVIFRTFSPDSNSGPYANVAAMVILTLNQLRLSVLNEMQRNSFTGPNLVFTSLISFRPGKMFLNVQSTSNREE